MRTKSAMLERSRFSVITATEVLDAGWLLCQTHRRRSAICSMAYSCSQPWLADTNYLSGAPLDQEKGRRALRPPPCPANTGPRPGSLLFPPLHREDPGPC